jgi:hypothetical protein
VLLVFLIALSRLPPFDSLVQGLEVLHISSVRRLEHSLLDTHNRSCCTLDADLANLTDRARWPCPIVPMTSLGLCTHQDLSQRLGLAASSTNCRRSIQCIRHVLIFSLFDSEMTDIISIARRADIAGSLSGGASWQSQIIRVLPKGTSCLASCHRSCKVYSRALQVKSSTLWLDIFAQG